MAQVGPITVIAKGGLTWKDKRRLPAGLREKRKEKVKGNQTIRTNIIHEGYIRIGSIVAH